MIGPVELLRLPADGLATVRRLLDEVVAVRMLAERLAALAEHDLAELRGEVAHVRARVDEIADSAPTRGPLDKVKDALTGDA